MKYVLMFCETEQWEKDWEAMDQAERDRGFGQVQAWLARYSDQIAHNRKLAGPETATTVRLDGERAPLITDGPFVEGKEVVSGYVEVEVADLDEAIGMARTWPGCPLVEIRPVLM
ncbi:YciI family protein [Nocardia cyriacigeorgica]|uniref:YciI family protein n=1 Tax=Nocardia cyriacigeorgica TaxID=135487 RepID=UPI0024586715|nr:YciI family protein [Nocardia cyriacigeorgica]